MATIEENNKLIAEFMGVYTMTIEELRIIAKENIENNLVHVPDREIVEDLKYHESWDWIMPVYLKAVDEIAPLLEGLTDGNENLIGDCTVDLLNGEIGSLQESLTKAIEWYNENESMGDTCRNGKPWDKCNCC